LFRPSNDRFWQPLFLLVSVASGLIVVLIFVFLLLESRAAWTEIGPFSFLTDNGWAPERDARDGQFNIVPALVGSLLVTLGAALLAAPAGILCAVFTAFDRHRSWAVIVRRLIELMAGIPSVVYGLWGLVVLVPLINRWEPPGTSLLAGTVVVALMILPTVALLADSAFRSFPHDQLFAAAAAGLSQHRTVLQIVFPAMRSALLTAVILAVVRALGETMAVLMVCGNVMRIPGSVFDPVITLTSAIALEGAYAMEHHRSALFFCGLVLLTVVLSLVLATEWTGRRPVHG